MKNRKNRSKENIGSSAFVKISAFVMAVVCLALSLASCAKTGGDGESEVFSNANEAYEAMTGAAKEGDFSAAVQYYGQGAADADADDANNWYYYSMAVNDYKSEGCLGYPLDLLQNKISSDFSDSKGVLGEIQLLTRGFDGAYSGGDGYFVYILDGKIAVAYEHLTEAAFCEYELVKRNDVYYWAKHVVDGEDQILYTVTKGDSYIDVATATDLGSADSMYVGRFSLTEVDSFPQLYY